MSKLLKIIKTTIKEAIIVIINFDLVTLLRFPGRGHESTKRK